MSDNKMTNNEETPSCPELKKNSLRTPRQKQSTFAATGGNSESNPAGHDLETEEEREKRARESIMRGIRKAVKGYRCGYLGKASYNQLTDNDFNKLEDKEYRTREIDDTFCFKPSTMTKIRALEGKKSTQ